MNIVLNIKESQLQGVLKALGESGRDVDIVINIKEEEFKEKEEEKTSSFSAEDVQRIVKEEGRPLI